MKLEKFWEMVAKYPWLLHAIGAPYDEIQSEIRRKGSLGIKTLGQIFAGTNEEASLWGIIRYIAVRPFASLPLDGRATCQYVHEDMEDERGNYRIHTGKVVSYLFYWHRSGTMSPFSECTELDGWKNPQTTVEQMLSSLLDRLYLFDAVVCRSGIERSAELLSPAKGGGPADEPFSSAFERWKEYQKGLGEGGGFTYDIYFPPRLDEADENFGEPN